LIDPLSLTPRASVGQRHARGRSPVGRTAFAFFALLFALLTAIVLVLDRQAEHGNLRQALSQLGGATQIASSDVRALRADLRIRAARLAASPRIQRALLDRDRTELQKIARASGATIRSNGISVGAMAAKPTIETTATISSRNGTIAHVTVAAPLNAATLARLGANVPMPPHGQLLLVRRGRIVAGGRTDARAVVHQDRLTLEGTRYLARSTQLPLSDVSLVAIEPLSDVSGPVAIYRSRMLIAALLTLLVAAGVAVPLARPLARGFAELSDRAERDSLTGLANRRTLDQRLEEEVDRAQRYATHLALVLVDIDDFKQLNDRFGHQFGDDLLRSFATSLSVSRRELDLVARFGGEEFALVLPGTPAEGACVVAEQVRLAVSELELDGPDGEPVRVTASFGTANFPSCATLDELVACADQRLYEAKRRGKNQVVGDPKAEKSGARQSTLSV
jgi:diguanylate cyclase (GGDEF)-like protein